MSVGDEGIFLSVKQERRRGDFLDILKIIESLSKQFGEKPAHEITRNRSKAFKCAHQDKCTWAMSRCKMRSSAWTDRTPEDNQILLRNIQLFCQVIVHTFRIIQNLLRQRTCSRLSAAAEWRRRRRSLSTRPVIFIVNSVARVFHCYHIDLSKVVTLNLQVKIANLLLHVSAFVDARWDRRIGWRLPRCHESRGGSMATG